MKNLKISFSLLIAFSLVFTACKKDDPEPVDPDNPVVTTSTPNEQAVGTLDLGSNVTANFYGEITDESGAPLAGVSVKIGNKSVSTDQLGVFVVSGASVKEDLAYVKCEKAGFFHGSRSLLPSTTSTNFVKIQMMSLNNVGSFAAGSATTISHGGVSIDFDGEYVDGAGNLYTGNVNVAMKDLPANDANTWLRMPGMLYAQNEQGSSGVLETYGMVAVELTSDAGEPLQLASGTTATIHMDVDATQLSGAPTTIPLWHFDEVAGYWVEEGAATLSNGEYVGDVDHFSFWNCDRFYEDCRFYGTVQDSNGPLAQSVSVQVVTPNAQTTGTSNMDGTFQTYLPANQLVEMYVGDYCASPPSGTFSYPGFPENSENYEVLTVSLTAPTYFNVTGMLKDCNGDNVSNGYVMVKIGMLQYSTTVTDGLFDFVVMTCSSPSDITVYCYAFDGGFIGDQIDVPVTQPTTVTGVVELCNQGPVPGAFIAYSVDGGPVEIFLDNVNYNDMGSYFTITDSLSGAMIQSHNVMGVGSHVLTAGTQQNTVYVFPTYFLDLGEAMHVSCLIDRFEGPGGYIHLTAWGYYSTNPSTTHTFELEAQAFM